MRTAIVLFTRDLRVHDNPALAGAIAAAEEVVPLFVLDPAITAGGNRQRFLVECLADLRSSLRARGADLLIRRGDPVRETVRLAGEVRAQGVMAAADVSRYAHRRQQRLAEACRHERISLALHPGVTVVPPGQLRPGGGGAAYQVFTPYWRAWWAARWRDPVPDPRRIRIPPGLGPGHLPEVPVRQVSPATAGGGEAAARTRLDRWLGSLASYADRRDILADEATSRLSPYLRFGCLSPLELVRRVLARGGEPAEPFVRQVCWRDFYHQVTAAFPAITTEPLRASAADDWRADGDALAAWQAGRTGVPVVDAGMRQLAAEGWLHNRARLLVASLLTKHLGLDWRAGAAWFAEWLLDGDVADNYGNWQWVAGTGNDTRPYRRFNPVRQAHRYDPDGEYVRRYVPELAGVAGGAVHEPWRLGPAVRRTLRYPPPIGGRQPAAWLPDAYGSGIRAI